MKYSFIDIYDSPYNYESVKQSEQSDNNGKTGEFVQDHDEMGEVVTLAVPEGNCCPQTASAKQRGRGRQDIKVWKQGLPAQ